MKRRCFIEEFFRKMEREDEMMISLSKQRGGVCLAVQEEESSGYLSAREMVEYLRRQRKEKK